MATRIFDRRFLKLRPKIEKKSQPMLPTPFAYSAPKTLEEAIQLLSETEGAKVIAGGQELLTTLKFGRVVPSLVIDLRHISDLHDFGRSYDEEAIYIGAMTTVAEVAEHPEVRASARVLVEAAQSVGDAQVRNRATIGGSLASGSPKADIAAAMLALEATLHVVGPNGSRTIPTQQFFLGPSQTGLEVVEIIKEIRFPLMPALSGSAYERIKTPDGFPLCGVAATVSRAKNGTVTKCQVAATGVSDRPVRLTFVESQMKEGKEPSGINIVKAARQANAGFTFVSNLFASSEYLANLITVLTERALTRAVEHSAPNWSFNKENPNDTN
jgi:carbon-monoxide dehydrogenase medium subunit